VTAAANVVLKERRDIGFALLISILLGLTIVRLIGLKFSVVDLFYDEAQYWAWSRDLAFGYSSKPPLLAWIIAAAEKVCGSGEACIRAPAPILYFATCLTAFGIAKTLYDERTAFWAALVIAFAPGTVFSARIISTDVPLMFCWALALLFYLKLLGSPRLRWGIGFGLVLGLGLLAKYAMIYFLLGVALAAAFDTDARALLRKPALGLGLAIAAAVVAPNMLWNAEHGFVTFMRVGENVKGDGFAFDPLQLPLFLLAQFAIVGPIAFTVLVLAFARIRSSTPPRADRLLLAFTIPPLAVITAAALVTKVNANWAAASLVPGAILAAAILVRHKEWKWLAASVAVGVWVQGVLLAGDAVARRVGLPPLLGGDVYRATMGWRELGEAAGRLAQAMGARTLAAERRSDTAAMAYYWRDRPERVLEWPLPETAEFDLTGGLNEAAAEPVLLITGCPFPERLRSFYTTVEPVGRIDAASGPNSIREFAAFLLSGHLGPIRPLAPCESGTYPPQFLQPMAVPRAPTDRNEVDSRDRPTARQ
jgi:4-amino-4-deoxy-L-arabinose transferase-like glycosyltransferase